MRVEFKYCGGDETRIVSTNTPFKVINNESCDWLSYTVSPTSITIKTVENPSYMDRTCNLTLIDENNNTDSIEVIQEGYRNMLVDLSLYVVIPYTYYSDKETYDLSIRIYGGNGEFKTDGVIASKTEKVFDDSDLYNDYVLHIDSETNGTFTFIHSDRDEYIKYCEENNIEYDENNLIKQVVIKNIGKEIMNGYTVFSYYGKEYINNLPPVIEINSSTPTVISVEYSCFFDQNLNFIEDCDFDITGTNTWMKTFYDGENKKIYLKASRKNMLSDRKCSIVVRNRYNQKQRYIATVLQKKSEV